MWKKDRNVILLTLVILALVLLYCVLGELFRNLSGQLEDWLRSLFAFFETGQ